MFLRNSLLHRELKEKQSTIGHSNNINQVEGVGFLPRLRFFFDAYGCLPSVQDPGTKGKV
jgi:hypothetical protein